MVWTQEGAGGVPLRLKRVLPEVSFIFMPEARAVAAGAGAAPYNGVASPCGAVPLSPPLVSIGLTLMFPRGSPL